MKMYEFFIYDRYGKLCRAVSTEFVTSSDSTALFFVVENFCLQNVLPVCYVRYAINAPGTGSVYFEFSYFTGRIIERVSVRQLFPSWDMRKIRKEWRCIYG